MVVLVKANKFCGFLICFLQMTKTIKKLEKERNTWKSKCESSNHSLVQMVDEVSEVIHF